MTGQTHGCMEFDDLVVSWDWASSVLDGPEPDRVFIEITGVWLPHPSDRKNEKRWLDITHHISRTQEEELIEQVASQLLEE